MIPYGVRVPYTYSRIHEYSCSIVCLEYGCIRHMITRDIMGLSAPVVDRPYFEFSNSSERSTKRVVWGAGIGPARLSHEVYKKKTWRQVSTTAYSFLWTRWYTYTPNINNAILPHTLAVFALGSKLVYCYDLGRMCDTKKYYVQEERDVTKSGHQYHT